MTDLATRRVNPSMKKRMLWVIGLVIGALVIWAGSKTSRAGYESPDYEVIEKDGKFEIRDYPTMTAAATPMKKDSNSDRNSGFGRLFRYISGDNEADQKIAMTTPVFVESEETKSNPAMMFVVPTKVAAAGTPDPKSESVDIRKVSGGQFAVLRFKGHRSSEKQKQAATDLKKRVAEKGLRINGDPMFAYYDPPWTPEFLRRNEVLIRLAP